MLTLVSLPDLDRIPAPTLIPVPIEIEIELEHECDLDPQLCDSILIFKSMLIPISSPKLDSFSKPTLIHVSIDFKIEPSLLINHILLMEKECEIKFFNLESILE